MRVSCLFYPNQTRLCLVVQKLLDARDLEVVPLEGTLIYSPKSFKGVGDSLSLLLNSAGQLPVLVTTNTACKSLSNTEVELEDLPIVKHSFYEQLFDLCKAKYATSHNQFSIDFVLDGCVLNAATVKDSDSDIVYTLKTVGGDVRIAESEVTKHLLRCTSIKCFKYTVVAANCEREVAVRKGQIEIYREIAHYVGKGLYFCGKTSAGTPKLMCLTATGCCEQVRNKSAKDGTRMVKLPYTRFSVDGEYDVFGLDVSLDVLLRAPSFLSVIRGGYL